MKRALIAIVILGLSGCTEDSTVSTLSQFNSRATGELVVGTPVAFVVTNTRGSIIVDGQVRDTTIAWFLDKTVTASSQSEADGLFSSMMLLQTTSNDTCYLAVTAPENASINNCSTSLTIPPDVPCIIRKDAGSLTVSHLRAALRGDDVNAVVLTAHAGSCVLTGTAGDITGSVAPGTSDSCSIQTTLGNITLRIPDSTSATIQAMTTSGTITTAGLVVTNPVQTPTSFSGTLGAGDAVILLKTTSGNITIEGQ
jgi:Toastrack DUF4097